MQEFVHNEVKIFLMNFYFSWASVTPEHKIEVEISAWATPEHKIEVKYDYKQYSLKFWTWHCNNFIISTA